MDSLPQEIINKIIDNLPRASLCSSSLVARRWRKRSQQHALSTIRLYTESMAKSWYACTQSDPGGISSYVQLAKFAHIDKWTDPALFGRVLGNSNSLTALWIMDTGMPNEVPEHVSRGELGKRITTLYLRSLRCGLPTLVSTIVAFPNLQKLFVDNFVATSREAPSTYPVLPQRGPLDSLRVVACQGGVAGAIANLQFTSRRLILDVKTQNIQRLLTFSPVTVVELELRGVCSTCEDHENINDDFIDFTKQSTSHAISLPPFPALTSLKIFVSGRPPSPHLVTTLSSISSVPALVSITLERWSQPNPGSDIPTTWNSLDGWLAWVAKNATIEGGLVLTLAGWPENLAPEVLPKFREVGKITTTPLYPKTRQ